MLSVLVKKNKNKNIATGVGTDWLPFLGHIVECGMDEN